MNKSSKIAVVLGLGVLTAVALTFAAIPEPTDITVPAQYGRVKETHQGTNGKLIIHIQDLHVDYNAQKNIAAIAEEMIKSNGVTLILEEGGSGDDSLAKYRWPMDRDPKEKVADMYLREGRLSGIDYLDFSSDYTFARKGLEDHMLYDTGMEVLEEIETFKPDAQKYLTQLKDVIGVLKEKAYNKELLELDQKAEAYDNEELTLVEYYTYLNELAAKKNMDLTSYPNFKKTIEKKYGEIDTTALYKEGRTVEDVLRNALIVNEDERRLSEIAKDAAIITNFVDIKLVPDEYHYYTNNKAKFGVAEWHRALSNLATKIGVSIDLPTDPLVISQNLPALEKFYNIALTREATFVRNAAKYMTEENKDVAILVAGGFHTPGITQRLRQEGYSYIVISPRVTGTVDRGQYFSVLKRNYEWYLKSRNKKTF